MGYITLKGSCIMYRLTRLESSMLFGMPPSQSMLQQHYLSTTYPATIYPDMYHYPPPASTYQQQYATVSPSTYQQQSMPSTLAGSQNVASDPHQYYHIFMQYIPTLNNN